MKRASRLRDGDLAGLRAFRADYPIARALVLYAGTREYVEGGIRVLPVGDALPRLAEVLSGG